jgi:hypothetical protein
LLACIPAGQKACVITPDPVHGLHSTLFAASPGHEMYDDSWAHSVTFAV